MGWLFGLSPLLDSNCLLSAEIPLSTAGFLVRTMAENGSISSAALVAPFLIIICKEFDNKLQAGR